MNSKIIRTRFAPSPTGELHVGNMRTAIIAYFMARQNPEGKFILRIDDTDLGRSKKEYEIRKNENIRFAEKLGIPFIDADYDVQNWFARAKGLEYAPERGERCT